MCRSSSSSPPPLGPQTGSSAPAPPVSLCQLTGWPARPPSRGGHWSQLITGRALALRPSSLPPLSALTGAALSRCCPRRLHSSPGSLQLLLVPAAGAALALPPFGEDNGAAGEQQRSRLAAFQPSRAAVDSHRHHQNVTLRSGPDRGVGRLCWTRESRRSPP